MDTNSSGPPRPLLRGKSCDDLEPSRAKLVKHLDLTRSDSMGYETVESLPSSSLSTSKRSSSLENDMSEKSSDPAYRKSCSLVKLPPITFPPCDVKPGGDFIRQPHPPQGLPRSPLIIDKLRSRRRSSMGPGVLPPVTRILTDNVILEEPNSV